MANKVGQIPLRVITNTVAPGAVKAPTVKELKNVLGAYDFQKALKWSTKKPAGAVEKEIVVQKPPKTGTGDSIRAFVLKSDPTKVYFEKGGSTQPHFFGPVSWHNLPK